ncbi:MAG: lytic murein transglycosylase [Patescibacteria group bacterium]
MHLRSVLRQVGLGLAFSLCFWPLISLAQALPPDKAAQEAQLQAQLKEVEAQIAGQTALLRGQQQETASVQRDIDILDNKIKTAQLKIKAKQIEIARLGTTITQKVKTIGALDDKVGREKLSLIELLRKTRELDASSVIEVALSDQKLSSFFIDLGTFNAIQEAVQNSLAIIRGTRVETETQKIVLEDKRDSAVNAQKAIEAEKSKIEQLNKEKNSLLKINKAQEGAYKKVIALRQQERSAILSALFKLRDAKGISFGQALEYATIVGKRVDLRPAYILAIITQESDTSSGTLGVNVGTCNRPQDTKKYTDIMKPERDIEPFLRITKALGFDPNTMPVSCPYGGGYGGAMGPAQFIPSTWEMFADRISSVTGHNPPDPWNAEDAFAAAGLLLSDNGASAGNYSSERKAALKYYAGGNWSLAKNAFYGDQVMAKTARYQTMINSLQGG